MIIFVGLAFKPNKPGKEGQSPISPLVAQLMALATVDTNYSAKLDDILEAARSSLNRLLSTMSVFDFIESVQSILLSEDVKVRHSLLLLFCIFYYLYRFNQAHLMYLQCACPKSQRECAQTSKTTSNKFYN